MKQYLELLSLVLDDVKRDSSDIKFPEMTNSEKPMFVIPMRKIMNRDGFLVELRGMIAYKRRKRYRDVPDRWFRLANLRRNDEWLQFEACLSNQSGRVSHGNI